MRPTQWWHALMVTGTPQVSSGHYKKPASRLHTGSMECTDQRTGRDGMVASELAAASLRGCPAMKGQVATESGQLSERSLGACLQAASCDMNHVSARRPKVGLHHLQQWRQVGQRKLPRSQGNLCGLRPVCTTQQQQGGVDTTRASVGTF